MPVWPGYFDRTKPRINVIIAGTKGSPEEVAAVIDTGFGGFMNMPESLAAAHEPVQLPTATTGTLADGSRVAFRTALVRIGFANRTEQGLALLVPSDGPCLLGIDFLRKFKMALVMTNQQVWLIDEDQFEEIALASGFAHRQSP
ncbi:hypothetical protein [Ramlibacter sp.]|uniref:hypothetical protein n=1 Tax=Ramlibacter sp. TaxID=1917967 RepID=UPI002607A921|nr:hypothetical protein [Ramlibacter sp.]MDB5956729.1 hypothetical protein [Ramlibacter sp.]